MPLPVDSTENLHMGAQIAAQQTTGNYTDPDIIDKQQNDAVLENEEAPSTIADKKEPDEMVMK